MAQELSPIDYSGLQVNNLGQDLLDQLKSQLHERSELAGKLIVVGALREGTDAALWAGKPSVAGRIALHDLDEGIRDQGLAAITQCYVATKPGSAVRCVEDRPVEGYDDNDPAWLNMPLGPQIQGGTPDEALAYRIAQGYVPGSTISDDVRTIGARTSPYRPGAHTGSHATDVRTDCGAVDNEASKLELYSQPAAMSVIQAKVAVLFELADRTLPADAMSRLQHNAADIHASIEDYMPNPHDAIQAVETLNPGGVPRAKGDHLPLMLVANYVRGETLHTGHFASQMNGRAYAFGLDVWHIMDAHDDYEAANILAAAVATTMRITDGYPILCVRTPEIR